MLFAEAKAGPVTLTRMVWVHFLPSPTHKTSLWSPKTVKISLISVKGWKAGVIAHCEHGERED